LTHDTDLLRFSRYMFVQNFIKLSAAVNELSCSERKNKLNDDVKNNTVTTTTDSNNNIGKFQQKWREHNISNMNPELPQ